MMESDTLVGNAIIKQLQSPVLLGTKGQYMKESNTLAGNATIKQLQREILCSTKGQHIIESNTSLAAPGALANRLQRSTARQANEANLD